MSIGQVSFTSLPPEKDERLLPSHLKMSSNKLNANPDSENIIILLLWLILNDI